MVKVNITGNAFAHKLAYGRGIHLVSPEIAKRLVEANVAAVVAVEEEKVETATTPAPKNVEKAVKKVVTKSKPQKDHKKK